jgi:hypothetical protein
MTRRAELLDVRARWVQRHVERTGADDAHAYAEWERVHPALAQWLAEHPEEPAPVATRRPVTDDDAYRSATGHERGRWGG